MRFELGGASGASTYRVVGIWYTHTTLTCCCTCQAMKDDMLCLCVCFVMLLRVLTCLLASFRRLYRVTKVDANFESGAVRMQLNIHNPPRKGPHT